MIPTVLLVDDDVELVTLLGDYLQKDGFAVTLAADGESAVAEALGGRHDIVVLDVMMPRMTGIDVLRRLRAAQSTVPVLMLTARGDDIDRIIGLELGADDYVPKPCSPRELAARLRAILRRLAPPADSARGEAVGIGQLVLRPERRTAHWRDHAVNLTGAEFNLLLQLMRHAGRLVTKAELSEQGLGRPLARFDRSIDVHISSIRQKLAAHAPGVELIKTVRGMGYQFTHD